MAGLLYFRASIFLTFRLLVYLQVLYRLPHIPEPWPSTFFCFSSFPICNVYCEYTQSIDVILFSKVISKHVFLFTLLHACYRPLTWNKTFENHLILRFPTEPHFQLHKVKVSVCECRIHVASDFTAV